MDRVPPRWLRRLVLAPLVIVICLAFVAVSPVLLFIAAVADVFVPGKWRIVRIVAFATFYLFMEAAGLLVLFGSWVRYGFRTNTEAAIDGHYGLMRFYLKLMYGAVGLLFGLRLHIHDLQPPQPGPVLVFSRHAGPGDSLMLIGAMMLAFDRRPRIVMLAKLQWDPLFDTMFNRLPNRFISHEKRKSDQFVAAIADLAEGLGDRDGLVLFPEGKDFKQHLRRRAIDLLRTRGFHRHADRAEGMLHVLPPRHRGPLAAIQSAPEADVVFVAHTVLEELGTFGELWQRIPLDDPLDARYWRMPANEVPHDQDEFIEWLYGWWERVDGWVRDHKDVPTFPRPGAES